jgi:hypothetical protein
MKHTYFSFCGKQKFHETMRNSLRHRHLRFGSGAFKTDAPDDTDDADAKEALLVQVRAAA